jgi:chromosome segregation ATPase
LGHVFEARCVVAAVMIDERERRLNESISALENDTDNILSELADVLREANAVKDQLSVTLPLSVFRIKNARKESLGRKEQEINTRMSITKRRLSRLVEERSQLRHERESETQNAQRPNDMLREFMKIAEEMLDPGLFGELRRIAALRVAPADGRRSSGGDALEPTGRAGAMKTRRGE